MPRVLLDTAAYIDIQRAEKHWREAWAANTIRNLSSHSTGFGKACLCPVGIMEIVQGFGNQEMQGATKRFLEHVLPRFEVVDFSVEESCLAGELYSRLESNGQRIGVVDTVLAATALVQNLTLVSPNRKHFDRICRLGYRLNVENWREP